MGNYYSSEELGDIKPVKPIINNFTPKKDDSPTRIIEYPVGYIDELKKNDKFNDRRSREPSAD